MRKGLPWVLALLFFCVGSLPAQSPPAVPSQGVAILDSKDSAKVFTDSTTPLFAAADSDTTYRIWGRAEYLLWWVKNAPLPVPLVTTGDPRVGFEPNQVNTVNTAGAIGQPGTRVLLGDGGMRFPAFSAMRFTLGGWVDEDQRVAAEVNGFVLERLVSTFAAASDHAGNPPLYFPIFSGIAGAERGIPIADPLRSFSGDVTVTSTLQLWGAECNGLFTFLRAPGLDFTVLAGFRYADLRENLHIHNTTTDLLFGNVTILNDSFDTSNQFYGGQIGGRVAVQYERFSLDLTGKVALGSTRQMVDIQGDITQAGPNPLVPPGLGTFPGGIYTQSSNIGRRNSNEFTEPFSVLPSLELKVALAITPRIRIFTAYEFMYWTHVLRPGSQIDHHVNLSQNAVLDPNGVGVLVGPAQPAPQFNRSDFWAQGVNVGLEFRY
jgi:hypothetical protein